MKLYKYRDLSDPRMSLERLQTILRTRAFWCARPDTLNDPEEFAWTCDFTSSNYTAQLLTELLIQVKGRSLSEAKSRVARAFNAGDLRSLAEPVISELIQRCRNEIGLACFGSKADNETLWERYAGDGAGLCIELEVPNRLLETQLYRVQYWDRKIIHIDVLLRSYFDRAHAAKLYELSLLSKPLSWAPEEEIRFVSKRQNVNVVIDGSAITRVVVGDALSREVYVQLEQLAGTIPLVSRNVKAPANSV